MPLLLLLLLGVPCTRLLGADEVTLTLTGSWPGHARGVGHAVTVSGNYAYTPSSEGLVIIDVSDPSRPRLSGGFDTPVPLQRVAVVGNYAYAAGVRAGLQVIDVSDPAQPQRVGGFDTLGIAYGVAVAGDYAYVADGSAGLHVIAVSDPAQPQRVGGFDTPGDAYGVAVAEDYAYVADGSAGLDVIDVSDPAQPQRVGEFRELVYATAMVVVGNHLYAAAGYAGLQVIDVSIPSQPQRVGGFDTAGFASDAALAGSYAYVVVEMVDTEAVLEVIDVSDPARPQRVGGYRTGEFAPGVTVVGKYVYLAGPYEGLLVIDVSNPAQPWVLGSYTPGIAYRVAVAGDYAYVADGSAGLQVIEVSDPAQLQRVGGFDTPGIAYGVAVAGNYAYVADGSAGLQVIEVSDPAQPQRVGGFDTAGYASDAALAGNLAYVADWSAGLQVIDVSEPARPQRVGGFQTGESARGVAVLGNYAYVADWSAGLQVIDVSEPARPQRVGGFQTADIALAVAVTGNYAYVVGASAGQVIDVSDPAQPQRAGGFETAGWASGVTVAGDYAYVVVNGSPGLQVIDVSNPARPQRVGGFDTAGNAAGVAVVGNFAYVADGPWGLAVVELAFPRPAPPTVSRQPQSQAFVLGQPVTLEVLALGPTPLSYQWRKNGEPIPGALGTTFELPSARLEDAGIYTVEVANEAGSVQSEPAALTPTGMPLLELVDHFEDRRLFSADEFSGLTNNLAATFQEAAGEPLHAGKRGGKSLWLTWRPPVSGIATFGTLGSGFDTLLAVYQGDTLATLQEVASDEDRGGFFTSLLSFNAVAGLEYHIAVDGFAGASGELILSWNLDPNAPLLPEITESPSSRVAAEGEVVTLNVDSPTPGVTYRWFFNGQELAGETQPSLIFPASPDRVGIYRARVTAANGAFLDSADALVEIVPQGIAVSAGDQLSADKWQDLFSGEAPPTPIRVQGRPTPMGFTAISLGVGARYTELRGATRSLADPSGCRGGLAGSRWFRFQVDRSRTVKLSLESPEVNATMTAYHAPPEGEPVMSCVRAQANGAPATNRFLAVAGVDYLVMVAVAGGGRGRVLLTWEGEEVEVVVGKPLTGWQDGRFRVVWPDLPAGDYELQTTGDLSQWQRLFQTNVTSGVIEYVDPELPSSQAKFFHLRLAP